MDRSEEVRELRELVRYRAKLVCLRTSCKLQVYAVLAKEGVSVAMSDLFGVAGTELLESCHLATAYRTRVESLRDLIEVFDRQIAMLEADVRHQLRGQAGYEAIQQIPGVGPLFASVFVAEIGDVPLQVPGASRELVRAHAETPRIGPHGPSGPDHQKGSRLVRWAAVEAAHARHRTPSSGPISPASAPTTATTSALARSPASLWREKSSPSSTTAFETAPSAPRPSARRRDAQRTPFRREVAAGHGPRLTGVAATSD